MLLFKLHSPRNFIVGAGFFTRFVHLPISLSWEVSVKATEFDLFRKCVRGSRSTDAYRSHRWRTQRSLHTLGRTLFFGEGEWIPVPSDFSLNIVQGKGYDSEDGSTGKALWGAVTERLATRLLRTLTPAQRLSQRSRVFATANRWSFDRDSARRIQSDCDDAYERRLRNHGRAYTAGARGCAPQALRLGWSP